MSPKMIMDAQAILDSDTSQCDFCEVTTNDLVTVTEDGNPWTMGICRDCVRAIPVTCDGRIQSVAGDLHIAYPF